MAQIKKDTSLRKAILQSAITGQLISSCHSESAETGKELLERIIEERNKKLLAEWEEALKKNPKAKKPAPVVASEIDEGEIPFEIPENWCWCRASEICDYIVDCPHSTPKYLEVNSGYCAIDTNCINEFGEITQYRFLSDTAYYERVKRLVPKENDIVYTREGSICRAAILVSRNVCLGQRVMLLRPSFGISSRFLQLYLMSPSTINLLTQKSVGMGVQHINVGDVHNLVIPLPPLSVQNAIVAKLEQVLPLVDSYENAILQKEELKSALPDKVKKAILQEAITGKLTETWRKTRPVVESVETTETGKQLLDRIISERNAKALAEWEEALKKNPKAKKPLAVVASEIEEDEIPFEVPDSWCWCHLGEICTKLVDGDHNPPAGLPTKTEYIMASSQNINNDSLVDLEKVRYLSKEVFEVENERTKAEKGDIFFTSVGTIGRSCVYDGSRNICFQRSVSVIKTEIYNKFLKYCLDTPFIQYFIIDNATGTAQKGFYLNQLAKLVIPLPPLEEQEEIVKKLEELLLLCK